MKMKNVLALVLLSVFSVGISYGAAKKKKKACIKLVSAYTKTVAEEEQSNPPMAGTFIVIKWDYATYPETFFWRGEGGWLTCNVGKAHKTVKDKKTEYTAEDILPNEVKKGDTLLLTPLTGGRFPIPDEIPQKAKNTLFYKTGGSKTWMSFVVKPIGKK